MVRIATPHAHTQESSYPTVAGQAKALDYLDYDHNKACDILLREQKRGKMPDIKNAHHTSNI